MVAFTRTARFRLMLMVLLAAVPALALILETGLSARQQAAEQARLETQRLVRLSADTYDRMIFSAQQLLATLDSIPGTQQRDPPSCSALYASLLKQFPQYTNIGVIDPQGNIICSGVPMTQPVNVGDRDYFQHILVSHKPETSSFSIGRVSHKATIILAYPVLSPGDQLEDVYFVGLDISALENLAGEIVLPQGSVLVAFDSQGTVLARSIDPQEWVGKQFPDASVTRSVLGQTQEGTLETTGVDGIQRIYAYEPLVTGSKPGAYLLIGFPTSDVYASADRMLAFNLIALGAVTLLGLFVAWVLGDVFFLRQIRAIQRAIQRWGKGDHSARVAGQTGTAELTQLGQAFDDMAEVVVEREEEIHAYTEQLSRSNRDLQDFAYISSHDLQEPLRKIQAFSERLMTHYESALDETGQDYLKRMNSSAARMQTLINDLLAYSRVATRAAPFAPVDLNEVAQEAISDLDIRLAETHGQVDVGELPVVPADPAQMRQVFQNLIANALKFHRPDEPPVVQVTCREEKPGWVEIRVSDNGIGFDEKYAERIFQPFQRLHGRSEYEGTGIGLAVCRKIVERHSGTITATSTPGEGSTFIVNLPTNP